MRQSTDTYSTYQLVYNIYTQTWAESDLSIKCGFINPVDNKMYLGAATSYNIRYERKNYDYTDFCDFQQTCTISSQAGRVLTINGTDNMTIGDVLMQGALEPSYITAISLGAGTVTIDNDQSFTLATADVSHLKAVSCSLEWCRDFASNPAGYKHFSEAIFGFKTEFIGTGNFSFSSDVNPSVTVVPVSGPSAADGWGFVAWGEGTWGGSTSPAPIRVGVPYSVARCNALTVKFDNYKAFSDWELTGFSLVFNPTSTRVAR